MLRRNIFGIGRRGGPFGLFLNENNSNMRPTMMILFYICFITIFLPQFTLAEMKPLTLSSDKDLKVMEGTSYQDGTILLRFGKRETNCSKQPLWFNLLEPDGKSTTLDVEKHSLNADNFCTLSKINNLSKRNPTSAMSKNGLVKRHPECDGELDKTFNCCAKYPDLCKEPKTAEAVCSQNPSLEGCKNICEKNPGGCAPPDCGKTPGAPGCTNGPSDCAKNPAAPGCNNGPSDCAKNPAAPGCNNGPSNCAKNPTAPGCNNPSECAKNPTAPGCSTAPLPDCTKSPYLPGCNDCTFNANAPGCGICSQNPQAERCLFGYCTKFPDVPECSLTMADKIKTHAIKEGFILVTYSCEPSVSDDTCGSVINWNGFEVFTIIFEKSCTNGRVVKNHYEKGFIYVCHKSSSNELFWATYGAIDNKGAVSIITSNTITSVTTFNSEAVNVFAIEDGGYSIVASSSISTSIFAIFILKDSKTVKGPYPIYAGNSQTATINVCNIAYQSSGYSCIISSKGNPVTYSEVDFLSNGNVTTTKTFDFTSITNNKVISDIQPLSFGGYAIFTTDRTSGSVVGYIFDSQGTYVKTWDLPEGFYTSEVVLPNNTIVAIPQDASNVGTNNNDAGAVTIMTTDSFTNFSSIDGVNGPAPGGPGGYGSSRIVTTKPAKGESITIGTEDREEFTITYTIPIVQSSGNVSVFQVNGNSPVLKQTVSASDGQFVSFENGSIVKFKVLSSAISAVNAPYYVTVDDDFVKELGNEQNVVGIRQNIWTFTTASSVAAATAGTGGDESAIIRLTNEGTSYYFSLPSEERKMFVNKMSDELAGAISCERDRLSTKGYQYDGTTAADQIIMRVDIDKPRSADQANSGELVKNLDEAIEYRGINSLSTGESASYLDASNGATPTEKLWNKYWGFLLAALILFALLIILFIIARIKSKEGGERNFLPIFLSALIPIDLALDIAFISLHLKDYKWIAPTAIIFLIFPIILNIIFTTAIIRREKSKHRTEFNHWWRDHKTTANLFKVASYLDTDALQVMTSRVADIESLSAPFTKEGVKSILFFTGIVVFFEDLPQFIFYSVYVGYHVKPAIVPILVLSSCIMVIVLKSTALLCSSCCYGEPSQGKPDSENSSTTTDSSDDEKDENAFAPDNRNNTTFNVPPTKTQEGPQNDEPPRDGGPRDDTQAGPQGGPKTGTQNKPQEPPVKTFGNIPTDKDNSKPVDSTPISPISQTEEKPTKSTPPEKRNSKDGKKGIAGFAAKFRRKSKDTPNVTSDDGETEETEETTQTTITTTEVTEATTSTTNKPRDGVDSTIRDSTIEEFDNSQKLLKKIEKDGNYEDIAGGTSNTTILNIGGGGGIHSYPGYSGLPILKTPSKADKLNTATGAAISAVTVAGGAAIRYIYIYLDEDEKEGKDKPISTIKTTTTKTSTSDGEKYITKTDNGKEYITIFKDGKYITKSSIGIEEYITTATNDVEYITKTISSEEYITIIDTTSKTISTTTTSKSTTKDIDEREYVTKSKSGSGKDGYIIITSSSESVEFITNVINTSTNTETVTDEEGNEIITVTVIETDETGKTTKTVTITKKDAKGNILDTNTETTIIGQGEVIENKGIGSKTLTGKQIETEESGTLTEISKEIETDEKGNTVTKVTTTTKDLKGNILDVNTETIYGVTEIVSEPEETTETTTTTRTVTSSGDVISGSSKTPTRKQTRTFSESETDENGILTITETTEVTEEDGTIVTTIVTTRKDQNGKVIGTNTETIKGKVVYEPVEETGETTTTTKTITSSRGGSSKTPTRKQTRTFSESETDENGTLTITETTEVTEEDGTTVTTIVTTRKDKNGKVIGTNTETVKGKVAYEPVEETGETTTTTKTITSSGGGSSKIPTRKQTSTESGIVTETSTETVTDENGKTTIKVTTIKKDLSGKVLDTSTEIREG